MFGQGISEAASQFRGEKGKEICMTDWSSQSNDKGVTGGGMRSQALQSHVRMFNAEPCYLTHVRCTEASAQIAIAPLCAWLTSGQAGAVCTCSASAILLCLEIRSSMPSIPGKH
eukprot:scaffold50297_cov22-Tisochrysis_lutea.AAC.4